MASKWGYGFLIRHHKSCRALFLYHIMQEGIIILRSKKFRDRRQWYCYSTSILIRFFIPATSTSTSNNITGIIEGSLRTLDTIDRSQALAPYPIH
jgi:hypothetical protein